MNIKNTLEEANNILRANKIKNSQLDCEILLASSIRRDKKHIILNPKENITITAPEKGENITKNEYTSNIRKKMVEMRDNRMGRRSR